MKAIPKSLAVLLSAALSVFLVSCSHPIEIAGDGDVTSESATRDCPLEEFLAGEDSCAKNYVALDYSETYYAEPRVGWDFHRWINYCTRATTNECSFNVPAEMVLQHWGETMPPLRAVFTNSNVWQGHACEMAIPEGLAESDFICGTFTAPLDWDNPFGETVDLEVAVLKSKYGLSKPDPYVYLGGGPGARNLEGYLYREAASILSPIAASRDIIFIDKRGLGLADPSLLCPELGAQNQQIYGTIQGSPEDVDSLLIAYQNCHSRIAETGVNLSHFNSYQVANDLASLITVLGYDEYNLFGISYGTREALMMMRDHPEKIRSVILDSTSLPGGNPENWAPNFARSYELLFASCAASSTCSAAYPNLEETLVTVVNQLNDEPHLSQVTQEDGSILDVYITGDRFIIGLHGAMYEVNLLPLIPLVIHSTAAGDMGLLDAFVPQLIASGGASAGLRASTHCAEEIPFSSLEEAIANKEGLNPTLTESVYERLSRLQFDLCEFWEVTPRPEIDSQPVVSDIPTLILAGQYDLATPPSYGQTAAETLSNSQFFLFNGLSHGILRAPSSVEGEISCAMQKAIQFLDDPNAAVDGVCASELPGPFD